ncbi:hypothetical protein WD019_04590 [Fictibacillus sp. Mic-4]|uniref:hypothetical protein n=1 Tax=Fictibacillus sp. Mic-4 TaxID=3132826 RepID=UPI003CF201E8
MGRKAFEPTRICSKCLEVKPFSGFGKDKNSPYGIRSVCRKCSNKQANKNYHKRRALIAALMAEKEENN